MALQDGAALIGQPSTPHPAPPPMMRAERPQLFGAACAAVVVAVAGALFHAGAALPAALRRQDAALYEDRCRDLAENIMSTHVTREFPPRNWLQTVVDGVEHFAVDDLDDYWFPRAKRRPRGPVADESVYGADIASLLDGAALERLLTNKLETESNYASVGEPRYVVFPLFAGKLDSLRVCAMGIVLTPTSTAIEDVGAALSSARGESLSVEYFRNRSRRGAVAAAPRDDREPGAGALDVVRAIDVTCARDDEPLCGLLGFADLLRCLAFGNAALVLVLGFVFAFRGEAARNETPGDVELAGPGGDAAPTTSTDTGSTALRAPRRAAMGPAPAGRGGAVAPPGDARGAPARPRALAAAAVGVGVVGVLCAVAATAPGAFNGRDDADYDARCGSMGKNSLTRVWQFHGQLMDLELMATNAMRYSTVPAAGLAVPATAWEAWVAANLGIADWAAILATRHLTLSNRGRRRSDDEPVVHVSGLVDAKGDCVAAAVSVRAARVPSRTR
ncbi:hypothetical protein JL720_8165 [Aureococcus anophagefferens]|nr:hypothetical protein JL720_8165 [Aureococcus anophagefferens]